MVRDKIIIPNFTCIKCGYKGFSAGDLLSHMLITCNLPILISINFFNINKKLIKDGQSDEGF